MNEHHKAILDTLETVKEQIETFEKQSCVMTKVKIETLESIGGVTTVIEYVWSEQHWRDK